MMTAKLKKILGMVLLLCLFVFSILLWSGCDDMFPERITKRAESFQEMCDYLGIAYLFKDQRIPFAGEIFFTFRTNMSYRSGVIVGKSDVSWDKFRRENLAEDELPEPAMLPENIILPKNAPRYERLSRAKYYELTLKSSEGAVLYWSAENSDLILVWGAR